MRRSLFPKSCLNLLLFPGFIFFGSQFSGCGKVTSEDNATEITKPTEGEKLTKAKKTVSDGVNQLLGKTTDPKIKKALEEAKLILNKAPTAEIANIYFENYKLVSESAEGLEAMNKLGKIFDVKTDPNAPAIKVDLGLSPATSAEVFALAATTQQKTINQKDFEDYLFKVAAGVGTILKDTNLTALTVAYSTMNYYAQMMCFMPVTGCADLPANTGLAVAYAAFTEVMIKEIVKESKVNSKGALRMFEALYQAIIAKQDDYRKDSKHTFNLFTYFPELRTKIRDERKITGTVTIPSGEVVLQLNGANDLKLTAAGRFEFTKKVVFLGLYDVTIKSFSDTLNCAVVNPQGYPEADVSNIEVNCTNKVTVVAPVLSYAAPGSVYRAVARTISPVAEVASGVTCSVSPALPTGLSLNTSTCAIAGTPTVLTGDNSYTVTATNAAGSVSATVAIRVQESKPVILISTPPTFIKNTAISAVNPTNSGLPIVSCAISPALPAGLSFSTTTCGITGTPTVRSASTVYTVTATNTYGSGTGTVSLRVVDPLPVIAYSPNVVSHPTGGFSTTPPSTFTNVSSCTVSPAVSNGLTFNTTTCAFGGTLGAIANVVTYTVTATNLDGGTATATFALTVIQAFQISYSGADLMVTNGTAETIPATITDGPQDSCSISTTTGGATLAASTGLIFDTGTCAMSGTVSFSGGNAHTFTVTATKGGLTDTTDITIMEAPPSGP